MTGASRTNAGSGPRVRLIAAAVGTVAAAAVALLVRDWLHFTSAYPWKAAAMFGTAASAAVWLDEPHPFDTLGPANVVTALRAMLVALIAGAIGEVATVRVAWTVVGLTTLAAVLDGVDGWLARRTRMASAFGGRIDMETDALLILVVSILVWQHGKAGAWVLLGGMMRYAFVAAGRFLPWMARPLTPTWRAKAITVVHIVGLTTALSPVAAPPASSALAAATLTALAWSFLVDVRRLEQHQISRGTDL